MKKEEDLVGRYIKALKDSPQNTGIKKGNFTKITYDNGYNYSIDNGCAVSKVNLPTDWELMPIGFNPSEVKEESIEEDLISQAKQRYPIGTKFYPAHLSQRKEHCIVTSTNFKISGTCMYQVTNSGSLFASSINSKYGNTTYNRCVYENGKWAEIIEEPKTNTTEEFKVGDWVVPLNDNTCHDRNIGEAYKIDTLEGSKAVRMFNRELKYDGNGWIEIKDLRKATSEEIAKAHGYKVTDTYFEYKQELYSEFIKNPEEYPIFAEPKKQKYEFSEVEYLAKPINQQLDLPIVKKYKKKSIINL
jgi:hypothetical protein